MIRGRFFSGFYRWFLAAAFYASGVIVVCSVLNLWFEEKEQLFGMFVWTTFQPQTSYIGWRFIYLQPLSGYLFAEIVMTTVHLLVAWFIFFKGDDQLPRWPFSKNILGFKKHSEFKASFEGKRIAKLFINGLVPNIWVVGFFSLKKSPLRFGMFAVLTGNALKLAVFAAIFEFIAPTKDNLTIITVITLTMLAGIMPYRRIADKFSSRNKLYRPE